MKKIFLSLIIAFTFLTAKAQDVSHMSWPSTAVLPEAGDWSIGFDVVPIINAAGNLFHSPTGNDSIFSQQQFTLVGLYVKNDNTAYRFKLRIGLGSDKWNNFVVDDANTTTVLTDTRTDNNFNITLGAGIQKSRGKGRLHLIYGAEAGFTIGGNSNSYVYGNPFSSQYQTPASTDFNVPLQGGGFSATDSSARITNSKDGTTFGFELNGFVGVEYFFAKKTSLSTEYGWGINYASTGEGSVTVDSWSSTSGSETLTTTNTPSSSAFSLDVRDAVSIILHFYL